MWLDEAGERIRESEPVFRRPLDHRVVEPVRPVNRVPWLREHAWGRHLYRPANHWRAVFIDEACRMCPDIRARNTGSNIHSYADIRRARPRRCSTQKPLTPSGISRTFFSLTQQVDALRNRVVVTLTKGISRCIQFREQVNREALVQRNRPSAWCVHEVEIASLVAVDQVGDPTTGVVAPRTVGRVIKQPQRSQLRRLPLHAIHCEALRFEQVGNVVTDLQSLVFDTNQSDDRGRLTVIHPLAIDLLRPSRFHALRDQRTSLCLIVLVRQLDAACCLNRRGVRREVRVEHRPASNTKTDQELIDNVVSVNQAVHRFTDILNSKRVEPTVIEERFVVLVDRRVKQDLVETPIAERDRQSSVLDILIQIRRKRISIQVRLTGLHHR